MNILWRNPIPSIDAASIRDSTLELREIPYYELKTPIASACALLEGMLENIGEYQDHPVIVLIFGGTIIAMLLSIAIRDISRPTGNQPVARATDPGSRSELSNAHYS